MMECKLGRHQLDKNKIVDHIDGNRRNNSFKNLFFQARFWQCNNARPNPDILNSGIMGVCHDVKLKHHQPTVRLNAVDPRPANRNTDQIFQGSFFS
jgi:hypothetical protein